MTALPQPINLFEFEQFAKERLPKEEYDYIAGGATDEISVDRNHRAFASWALRPRVLRDVSALDLSTTVLGTKVSLPVLIAPCGGHKRAHPDGELTLVPSTVVDRSNALTSRSTRGLERRSVQLSALIQSAAASATCPGHSAAVGVRPATDR